MARTRKSVSTQNLIKYDVLIEDRGTRSDYFKISQFDGYLYGGRNAFLVAGSGVLRPRSKVLVEVLNKDGSTIFSAPVSSFVEGNSRLIQVEIYEDAPIGPGKIVILGSADTYIDGTPIPTEWRGKYNVRWITDVIISPRIENRTQIRFQRPPSMTVSEKFYFAPSSSLFSSSQQLPLDIEFSPKFLNVYPNGYLAKIITSGSVPSTTARYFSNYAGGVLSGSVKFVGPQGPETASINLPLNKIYTSKLAESDGNLIVTDKNRILNSLVVSSSGQYTTNISPIGSVGVTSSLNLVYNKLTTQDTGSLLSFADIRVVDLETISGEINKVRFSYKSATRPGAYKVIGEVTNEVDELFSVDTGSRIAETGRFRDVITDDYWYTATMSVAKNEINPTIPTYYVTSSLVTGSTVTQCCTDLLDSINATPEISGSKFIDNVSYFIGNKDTNSIQLFPRSEYTLTLDALVTKESASYSLSQSDYSLEVYLVPISGSTKLLETNKLGQLIGTLTPRSGFKSQRFNQLELNFVPRIIQSGQFGVRFVVYGGFWNIANVSVKTATEPFFSPDELDALLPNLEFQNEILEFRAEYLDINNNSIGITTISLPTFFSGSEATSGGTPVTFPYTGSAIITGSLIVTGSTAFDGDLTVGGRLTAEEFYTEVVSSSIIYRSGSTKFGDSGDDTHQFTGSVIISGSSTLRNIGPAEFTGSLTVTDQLIAPNIVSSSTQIESLLPNNVVSSSAQINHDQTTNYSAAEHFTQANITTVGTVTTGNVNAILPIGTVSASAQIDHDATTNYSADEHFTQANITTVGTVTSGNVNAILPSGVVSASSQINHDSTTGFVSNEHIDHSTVSISAGTGLTGGGTIAANRTISLSHLGIQSLTDPNADRILFWDDSAGATNWLTVSTGLSLSNTTLTNTGVTSAVAGNAITVSGATGAVTINHADTSTQSSVNNSGRTFIQDITLDTYGHVTAITSATDSDTYTGTVTSIATNNGLTGGTITSTGTIGLTGQALALHNLATNGLIARTGTGTVAGRTITAGTGISVTNGNGVSGNPTITNTGVTSVNSVTGAVTAANLLTAIKTVDGASSGLDADLLDGNHASAFYLASNPSGYTSNTGTVTSVATGTGLTGGTITTTGTISHADTSALNGAYGSSGISSITVDSLGHVTSISTATYALSNGSNASGTWGINISGNAATATSATTAGSATTATSATTAGNITDYTINQSVGTGNSPTFTGINIGNVSNAYGGQMLSGTGGYEVYYQTGTSGAGIMHWTANFGGFQSLRAYLMANGGFVNYQANDFSLSDERLKTDIIDCESYLDKLCSLEVKKFRYKDQGMDPSDENYDSDYSIGLIAQQVLEVAPEFVNRDSWPMEPPEGEEKYMGIYSHDIYFAMLKSIQELTARVKYLESRSLQD